MKRLHIGKILTAVALVAAVSSAARADDERSSTAIGFHTLGGEFTQGTPTMRWRSGGHAFDATPIVTFSDTNTSGPTQTKTYRYGLNVGYVKNVATMGGLRAGVRLEGGYDYRYDDLASNTRPFSSQGKGYDFSVGIGPDFEYFFPGLTGFSVGAQGVVQYAQSYNRILTATATNEQISTVGFKSAVFTLRYYFK